MAEFALGLTKTAVEGTLIRVKSAIEEEAKLKVRVQNDLLFITGEFEMMRSFLKVANKDRAKNEVVQTWVRQLRDLAFDVEDCVEFVVHLDNKSAWNWFWRVVPACMRQPLPLDVAVAEIHQLKVRVEDVSQRNTRYNLITNTDPGSSKSTETTVKALEKRTTGSSASSSAFHILTKVWDALGKQRGLDNLKNVITSEGSDLQVVSIWGSTAAADLGRSSIFRKVYSDPEICYEFKTRAWVQLTTHPFSPDEFRTSLLNQLNPSSSQQAKFDPDHLMRQLKEQRYLIILEQISTVVEWNALRSCLPDSNNGSRIIVSTRDFGVALLCTGEMYQVSELTHFSYGQSLAAFHKKGSMCRSDIGEFHWQLRRRRHGVISVWGTSSSKPVLYKGMIQKCIETEFKQHIWLDIIGYFNLTVFARNLLMKCYPQYEQEAEAVYALEMVEVVQLCCKFLREHDCLVVITGLRCTTEWDSIKEAFLSEPIKSNIVVFTNEGKVAEHCADEYRMLSIRDALTPPGRLTKGGQYYGNGLMPESSLERQSSVFTKRREEAVAWCNDYSGPRYPNDEIKLRKSLAYPGVISVWGIPGIGKSDLVRTIYYDLMTSATENEISGSDGTKGDFSQLELSYSWVDVPCPFNLIEFSQHLLLDFYSDNLNAMEGAAVGMMDGQDPVQLCSKFLLEDQCLVVINGLQSTRDWESIKDAFLSGATRSCIIVITSEQSVATHCVDHENQVLNIKSLEADEALELFMKIAWSSTERELTPRELELSKVTISKCGGIPKVIASVGEYCRASTMTSLGCLNSDFIGILEADIRFHELRGLFSWMHLKFDASSDSIKRCIFYLPVFPIDHKIRRRRLLRRWIAEAYSRDTFAGTTAEENGEMLFSMLVDLGVIQMRRPPSGSREGMCQVNGFFHGYIISRTMSEDNLVCALDGCCSLNSQRTGRHVSISESWERDILVFESIDLSRLRSLTVFGKWEPFLISAKMKRIRVLDLEDSSGVRDDDLEKIVKLLHSLKFLSVRGCREIRRLPDSIGGLVQLHSLDVRDTSIVTLPPAIIKLRELQYIRAGNSQQQLVIVSDSCTSTLEEDEVEAVADEAQTSRPSWSRATWVHSLLSKLCGHRDLGNGVKVPNQGIGKLTALHTIGVVYVHGGESGKAFLKELKKLTQLRKLGLSGINSKNWYDLCSSISGHCHLESLSVRLNDEQGQCSLDDVSKPPKTLKSLKLYGGNVHVSVAWVKQLGNLRKAHLQDLVLTISTQEDIDSLMELQCQDMYHRLCLKPAVAGVDELHYGRRERTWHGKQFSAAKILEIDCGSCTPKIVFGYCIADHVEVILVRCSTIEASLEVSGLDELCRLKEVRLQGLYSDALKQHLQQKIDELPSGTGVVLKLED